MSRILNVRIGRLYLGETSVLMNSNELNVGQFANAIVDSDFLAILFINGWQSHIKQVIIVMKRAQLEQVEHGAVVVVSLVLLVLVDVAIQVPVHQGGVQGLPILILIPLVPIAIN